MNETIRQLTDDDLQALQDMDTGIDDDYVIRVFDRISTGNNRLFGLFHDGRLASIGGYTIFAGSYAMLGRMRSDVRFRGQSLSSRLMAHVRDAALDHPGIRFVGANTQEFNLPARRVLEKSACHSKLNYFLQSQRTWSLSKAAQCHGEKSPVQKKKCAGSSWSTSVPGGCFLLNAITHFPRALTCLQAKHSSNGTSMKIRTETGSSSPSTM